MPHPTQYMSFRRQNLDNAVSVQPVPKAVYCSGWREKYRTCLQHDAIMRPYVLQSDVLRLNYLNVACYWMMLDASDSVYILVIIMKIIIMPTLWFKSHNTQKCISSCRSQNNKKSVLQKKEF